MRASCNICRASRLPQVVSGAGYPSSWYGLRYQITDSVPLMVASPGFSSLLPVARDGVSDCIFFNLLFLLDLLIVIWLRRSQLQRFPSIWRKAWSFQAKMSCYNGKRILNTFKSIDFCLFHFEVEASRYGFGCLITFPVPVLLFALSLRFTPL